MFNKRWLFALALIAFTLTGAGAGFGAHGDKAADKKAILLVAFGTSVPEAQQVFDKIDAEAKKRFPGVEIRWAYTSGMIRAKLAKQGKILSSPEEALAKLMAEHYTHVAVLSLQTIPGREFHDLYRNAMLFGEMAGGFKKILVAQPLLSSYDDMVRTAKGLIANLPPERMPGERVIFMGHGSEKHPADAMYLAMNQILSELDPNIFVATVEGHPSIEELSSKFAKDEKGSKKTYLIPFMLVAGDHAMKDMAGDEPDSWKSILTKDGYRCEIVLKGTGDYPQVVDVWMDHLQEAFSKL